jgi:hypothetical protein
MLVTVVTKKKLFLKKKTAVPKSAVKRIQKKENTNVPENAAIRDVILQLYNSVF